MRSDWTPTTLGSLVSEGSAEYQTGPFGTMLKASEYSIDGAPLISVGEIREGFFAIHDDTPRVCEKTKQRLPQFVLMEGDIVFGRKGAIHRNAIISKAQAGWFLGSDGIRLRLSSKHDPLFFSYFLRTPMISRWLIANSPGAIMPTLNESILDRVPLFLPEMNEQQRISSILSTLDAKIELNNRINEELEGMAKLLYDYWFVQFDFPMTATQAAALGNPQLAGKPYRTSGGKMIYNETLKREIPEGWDICTVGEVLAKELRTKNVLSSKIAKQGKIPVIDQGSDFICGFTDDEESVINETPKIVFGDHTRILKFINFPFARGADGTQILTSREKRLPQHLFYFQLLSVDLSNYGYARHFKFLKDQKVILPHQNVANVFEEIAEPPFSKIKNNIFQNQELTQLRDWLLPMLMNGQVTVN
jgi:type I restriction enzyme S subunit